MKQSNRFEENPNKELFFFFLFSLESKKTQGWRIYEGCPRDGSSWVTKRFLERSDDDGVELDDDEARSRPAKMRR